LCRDGVEVGAGEFDRDRARRLRAIDEKGRPIRPPQPCEIETASGRPKDMRDGEEPGSRRHGGEQRLLVGLRHEDVGAARAQRSREAEVLLTGRDHLVACAETEACDDDLAGSGRRVGERDELR
jgi:hypothetical protein